MPEQPDKWPRGAAWTLTHAHDAGRWRTSAARCNVTRYYKPIELREVIRRTRSASGASCRSDA
ncbi:hypothetical protein X739_28820 [Mesorhizobium sp. LNHC220B00]|nr:hypothetical protein X739_28820 [Mesorhizobium sp. LNHC220B00]